MPVITPDTSEFQVALDHRFARDFAIFRASFGAGYQDRRFLANAAEAKRQFAAGRLAGALPYHVYLAGHVQAQFDFFWSLIGPTVPDWLAGVELDVETWRGQPYQIRGDHSAEVNELAGRHAHRFGTWDAVVVYGNEGDLHEVCPNLDKRLRVNVASYSSRLVTGGRVIGQQYTDGSGRWPVPRLRGKDLPRSSAPFGPCDHNVFPGFADGKALRAALRPVPGKHVAPPPKPVTKPVTKPVPRPPAKPPVAPAPHPHYPHAVLAAHDHALVSADGRWAAIFADGHLEIRHDGAHIRSL